MATRHWHPCMRLPPLQDPSYRAGRQLGSNLLQHGTRAWAVLPLCIRSWLAAPLLGSNLWSGRRLSSPPPPPPHPLPPNVPPKPPTRSISSACPPFSPATDPLLIDFLAHRWRGLEGDILLCSRPILPQRSVVRVSSPHQSHNYPTSQQSWPQAMVPPGRTQLLCIGHCLCCPTVRG